MRFTPGIGTILRILEREDADGGKRFEVVHRLQSQGGVVKVKSKALATNARRPNAALGESRSRSCAGSALSQGGRR